MTTLNPQQILMYIRSAGWSGQSALDALGVVLAESSGDTSATSRNPDGGINVGLFQLDTRGVGAGYTVAQLQDPATNARVARKGYVADGMTFGKEWATWPEPAKSRLAEAMAKDKSLGSNSNSADTSGLFGFGKTVAQSQAGKNLTNAVQGNSNPLSLAEQAGSALTWLFTPANWGRLAMIIIGGVVVIVGLNQVAKPVTEPVVNTGKKIGKAAAVAAAV